MGELTHFPCLMFSVSAGIDEGSIAESQGKDFAARADTLRAPRRDRCRAARHVQRTRSTLADREPCPGLGAPASGVLDRLKEENAALLQRLYPRGFWHAQRTICHRRLGPCRCCRVQHDDDGASATCELGSGLPGKGSAQG